MRDRMPSHPLDASRTRGGRSGGEVRRRERHLSRDAIVEAALRVVDDEGVDAVTMRRVAHELRTGPASLYAHVRDKDELLAAVFDRVLGDADLDVEPDAKRWDAQIKELMRQYRRLMLRHRDLAKVSLASVPRGPNGVRAAETSLAVLNASGLPPEVVGFAGDLLAQFVTASAYEEALFRAAGDLSDLSRELLAFFEQLPASEYPTLTLLAPYMANPDEDPDARFEFGLDILVSGLAARAPQRRDRRR